MSKFSGRIMREDPELFDSVNRWLQHETSVDPIKIVCAIDQKIIFFETSAADGNPGYAALHPISTNAIASGRSRNRRVEIVLLRSGQGSPASLGGELP